MPMTAIPSNEADYQKYFSNNRPRIMGSMIPAAEAILTDVQIARKKKELYRKISDEQYELFPDLTKKFNNYIDTLWKVEFWARDPEAISILLRWKEIKDFIIYMSMDDYASKRFAEILLENIKGAHPDYYDLATVVTGMMYNVPVQVGGKTIHYNIDDIIEHPEKYEKK